MSENRAPLVRVVDLKKYFKVGIDLTIPGILPGVLFFHSDRVKVFKFIFTKFKDCFVKNSLVGFVANISNKPTLFSTKEVP